MPVRRIPKNYRNLTGIGAHRKGEGKAAFESTLERDYLALLEFSPEVEDFEVQPVAVEWTDASGRLRSYTPDVLVRFVPGAEERPLLVEVKYRSDLRKNWADLYPRFKAAVRYAKAMGWRFKIMTDVEIRTPYLQNVRFLLPFMRRTADDKQIELIRSRLEQLDKTTPKSLISSIYPDQWDQATLLPSLWQIVGSGGIGIDLFQPLNMDTPIWHLG